MIGIDHLPHQRKGEEVVLLLRRHPLILLLQVLLYVILALIPVGLRFFIAAFFPDLLGDEATRSILTLALLAYYLFVWLFLYHAWVDYYLDAWIVTTHRVLSIELQGLFNRVVAEHKLFRIQDVTTEQVGFLAHFFKYGDVHIQTAGAEKRFIFEQIPDPDKVARQITQMIAWHKKAYPEDK